MLKPLYFSVVVWGERHRRYLLDYCVSSLLAPNNIPSLILGKKNRFIIACPLEDKQHIDCKPVMRLLKQYITVEYMKISPCPADKDSCLHMGEGHRKITDKIYDDQVYGSFITPDQLFPDYSISFLQDLMRQGYEVVYTPPAYRTRTDQLFPLLEQMKQGSTADKGGVDSLSLVLTKSQLIKIISQSVHDSWKQIEWSSHRYAAMPWGVYWSIYDKQNNFKGFVYYTQSWAISLADYGAINSHNNDVLNTESFDASYLEKNFKQCSKVYFVTSGDEFVSTSWSDNEEYRCPLYYEKRARWRVILSRMSAISVSFFSDCCDAFKRNHFIKPIVQMVDSSFELDEAFIQQKNRLLKVATSRYFYVCCLIMRTPKRVWYLSLRLMVKKMPWLKGIRNKVRNKVRGIIG